MSTSIAQAQTTPATSGNVFTMTLLQFLTILSSQTNEATFRKMMCEERSVAENHFSDAKYNSLLKSICFHDHDRCRREFSTYGRLVHLNGHLAIAVHAISETFQLDEHHIKGATLKRLFLSAKAGADRILVSLNTQADGVTYMIHAVAETDFDNLIDDLSPKLIVCPMYKWAEMPPLVIATSADMRTVESAFFYDKSHSQCPKILAEAEIPTTWTDWQKSVGGNRADKFNSWIRENVRFSGSTASISQRHPAGQYATYLINGAELPIQGTDFPAKVDEIVQNWGDPLSREVFRELVAVVADSGDEELLALIKSKKPTKTQRRNIKLAKPQNRLLLPLQDFVVGSAFEEEKEGINPEIELRDGPLLSHKDIRLSRRALRSSDGVQGHSEQDQEGCWQDEGSEGSWDSFWDDEVDYDERKLVASPDRAGEAYSFDRELIAENDRVIFMTSLTLPERRIGGGQAGHECWDDDIEDFDSYGHEEAEEVLTPEQIAAREAKRSARKAAKEEKLERIQRGFDAPFSEKDTARFAQLEAQAKAAAAAAPTGARKVMQRAPKSVFTAFSALSDDDSDDSDEDGSSDELAEEEGRRSDVFRQL